MLTDFKAAKTPLPSIATASNPLGNPNTKTGHYKFITSDGMSIVFITSNNNCGSGFGLNSNSPTTKTCGFVWVDVNGKKGPNYLGRDVFYFFITSNKTPILYPRGGKEDNIGGIQGGTEGNYYWNVGGANNCSATNKSGFLCAGRVLEKGTMDY